MVRSKEETEAVGERGLAIYEKDIAPQLSDHDRGRYVAIDVNTGEWEIGDSEDATELLRERVPNADIFLLKHIDIDIGFFGGVPEGFLKGLGISDSVNGTSE